jgi:hypothetical protein
MRKRRFLHPKVRIFYRKPQPPGHLSVFNDPLPPPHRPWGNLFARVLDGHIPCFRTMLPAPHSAYGMRSVLQTFAHELPSVVGNPVSISYI